MAKAKKTAASESTEKTSAPSPKSEKAKPAAAQAGAAKAAPAAKKKAPAKKPAAPATAGLPQIDTGLAAQSAAAMLVNRPATETHSAPKTESATFKNLKDQLAKPKPASLSHILGTAGEQKKGPSHFMNQQKGHNQTYGGFNKTGVPRRTNG